MSTERRGVPASAMARAAPSATATPVALSVAPLQIGRWGRRSDNRAEVVVVGTEHDPFVGQVAAGDDAQQVGTRRKHLPETVIADHVWVGRLGELCELPDQDLLRGE